MASKSKVYFELGLQANKAVKWSTGTLIGPSKAGIAVEAKSTGMGTYAAVASNFAKPESKVGVVIIVKTFDSLGQTSTDRQVALHGSPWLSKLSKFLPYAHFDINGKVGSCTQLTGCKQDGNPCTSASCVSGACKVSLLEGKKCSDGKACTVGDVCKAGQCVVKAKICNDGNACTADSCDPKNGACLKKAIDGKCSDGNQCPAPWGVS